MMQVTRGDRGRGCLKLLRDLENGDKLFGVELRELSDRLKEKIDASEAEDAPDNVWEAAFKMFRL